MSADRTKLAHLNDNDLNKFFRFFIEHWTVDDYCRIDIRHADGVLFADTLLLSLIADMGVIDKLRPIDGLSSILSGENGVLRESGSFTAVFTPEELVRLQTRSLRPYEVLKLIEIFSDKVFEWHDDFYDPKTGEACQPTDYDAYRRDLRRCKIKLKRAA